MHLIKLGGSVITDKSSEKTLRKGALYRLTKEIAASGEKVILIHGAGSFGHILAKEGKLNGGFQGEWQFEYFSKVQKDVRELNLYVLSALLDAGLRPVSLPPSMITIYKNGVMEHFVPDIFELYLELGMTPVSFGDVVLDKEKGFAICSGDHLMSALSSLKGIETAIFVTDVDGIYDRPPDEKGAKLMKEITPNSEIATKMLNEDVTGGMKEKIRHGLLIAENRVRVRVINGLVEGRLEKALKGEPVAGTEIRWSSHD